ncbi:hypothetical protein BKA63DRAFT_182410 [Paraphoma chrysanthemicola]|nr:hypothetical protein BKA63DRAFT_182410 [Paraphoma chrysanthemicola]
MLIHALLLSIALAPVNAALHLARRQLDLTFKDVCGADGIDCKNGYCCMAGSLCVPNDPPLCRDLVLHDWTMQALDYSSFINLINLNDLTTLGLTLSNIPRTLTFSTSLPVYTENSMPPQYTLPTYHPELATPTRRSLGGAPLATPGMGHLVGGVLGVGVILL